MTEKDDIAAGDAAVVELMWRKFGTGELREVRRLQGRSHRTFECAQDRGGQLIVRLADPARARFALEAAVLRRCAESGVINAPGVRHVGIEAVPGGEGSVAVMVQEKLPGTTLGAYAADHSLDEAHAAVARAGEALVALPAAALLEPVWKLRGGRM